nr:hypothetical protein [Saccharofermentans sp.]
MTFGMLPSVTGGTVLAADGVAINDQNFPDANFRSVVNFYDSTPDGILTSQDISSITGIFSGACNIASFKGIEYLTSLEYFDYEDSGAMQSAEIDVSKNTALTYFVLDLQGLYVDIGEFYYGADLNLGSNTYLATAYREATPRTYHSTDDFDSYRNGNLVYEMKVDGVDVYLELSPNISVTTFDSQEDVVNMYRLYNRNSGEHFYTSDSAERDHLMSLGWSYEGLGWTAPAMSNTPVYRLYNQYGGEHHYTTSVAERDSLVAAGWTYESIGW